MTLALLIALTALICALGAVGTYFCAKIADRSNRLYRATGRTADLYARNASVAVATLILTVSAALGGMFWDGNYAAMKASAVIVPSVPAVGSYQVAPETARCNDLFDKYASSYASTMPTKAPGETMEQTMQRQADWARQTNARAAFFTKAADPTCAAVADMRAINIDL